MLLRALEPADLPALATLCASRAIAAELIDAPSASSLQDAPGTNAAIGAFEGDRLVGAAGMTAFDRPRLRHSGRAWLAADPLAAAPLLASLRDLASAWWKLDRLGLAVPSSTQVGAALAAAGFELEVRRRADLASDDGIIDSLAYAWVRPGIAFTPSPPPRSVPTSPAVGDGVPASFELRPCIPADADGVARVYADASAIWGTLQTPFTPAEVWRKRLQANEPGRNRMFVATVGEEIVGTCGLHLATSPRRPHVSSMGMGLVRAWQGRGIGHAMMAHLLATAAGIGVRRLELEVYADNAPAAALYEKHGFVREGVERRAAWRDGAHVDVVVMARLG